MPSDVENKSPTHAKEDANEGEEQETKRDVQDVGKAPSPDKGKAKQPSSSTSGVQDAENVEGSGGEDGGEDGEEEEEKDEEEDGESKDKSTTADSNSTSPQPQSTPWQAVYSPQYGAYYFYNTTTGETTWSNPLAPEASGSTPSASGSGPQPQPQQGASDASGTSQEEGAAASSSSTQPAPTHHQSAYAALQEAAIAQGIDPALAHLDPSLLAPVPGSSRGPGTISLGCVVDIPTFKAQFNARTGAFAPMSSRTPGHLSEVERAKRMSEVYFDVHAWENQLAEQGGSVHGAEEEAGNKRKRPTKKDLERFKEQKRAKKMAKTAWLRS